MDANNFYLITNQPTGTHNKVIMQFQSLKHKSDQTFSLYIGDIGVQ